MVNLPETAECGAAMAFAAIRHKYRDWLAYKAKLRQQRMPPVYIYTFENPAGRLHVNWVVHVPDALQDEFREKLQQWVTKVRGVVGPYDVHVQPVEVAYHKRLAKYVLKGTDRNYTRHFHLEDVDEGPQGEVWGRRAGISQAIGRRARARDSYHPGRNRPYIPAFMTPPTGGGGVGSWRSAPP